MSTDVMMEQIAGASPRLRARTAGALWLIIIVAASFSEFFVRGRIVVDGDAAATATNILAHEPLYRLGAAAALIYLLCDTAVALILYELLKPVSRSLSLLASFFRLAMVAILGSNLLNLFAPLVLLKGAPLLTAFKAEQLQALALVSLKVYAQVFFIPAMLFFGFHCLLIGYLIYRSTFLPRILGALMAITGLCYLTNSFANVLSPALAARLFTYLMPLGLPGELSLTLWLLAIGVNVQRWKDQAGAAEEWRSQRAMNA
ncbi:MAG TPA: DUF4386 domain-containing protein [Blastocatellia bacterium]|nr:DUF4386 domain-containing protein [Blastocatellia bacterium]